MRGRFLVSGGMSSTLPADLAVGDLGSLRAVLSGWGTRGTSLTAQLDARLDTENQDKLLTWAAQHGQAEAVRLLLEAGASVSFVSHHAERISIASVKGVNRAILDRRAKLASKASDCSSETSDSSLSSDGGGLGLRFSSGRSCRSTRSMAGTSSSSTS